MSPNDPVTRLFNQALDALAAGGGDLPEHAQRLRSILTSPPQVVIVGRLKAGKSTLVNALTGDRVAATAALECTNAVSIYRNGTPARAEVVGLDGTRQRQDLVEGMLLDLGRPVTEVAWVDRFLPARALEAVSLIDTPGIATLTTANAEATERALIDGFAQTRTASVDADALVFLFDSAPRRDELDFIGRLGFTPLNSIGVLSRADGFGEGAMGHSDPIDEAASHCAGMSKDLAAHVSEVLPLAGLLAESARSGQVTQQVARTLRRLAELDHEDLLAELENPAATVVATEERDTALDLLGEYGVIHGAAIAHRAGAAGLIEWMQARSGITALEEQIHTALVPQAVLQRAVRLVDSLDRLAYTHPAKDHIRQVLHILFSQQEMRSVLLFRSFRGLMQTDARSRFVPLLSRLLSGRTAAARVGLPDSASISEVRAAAQREISDLQNAAMLALSAAEEDARIQALAALRPLAE